MSELDSDIALGEYVRDELSGYEGHVTAISEHLTGCTRVEIAQSESPTASTEWFYIDQVEVCDDNLNSTEFDHTVVTGTDISLGERVRDTVTRYEGIVVMIVYELFNCPRVMVQTDNDGKETERFDAPRVTVVGDGIADSFGDTEDTSVGKTGFSADMVRTDPFDRPDP